MMVVSGLGRMSGRWTAFKFLRRAGLPLKGVDAITLG
ncbi:hypothetical protein J2Z66_002160 [Paenibacillus eucommiae]|uniref:Uncharacterized protein n=1 Tax=Paenibacillus eucommiae TaxID=1355755 RepID=A0ABS4IVH1_9BACL|nr:hypothetical protein [Paenibacillus eucommiae]